MLGNMQLIQTQGLGQSLLSEGLFGEHGGHAVGTFFALRWVQQNELLNLAQLFEKLFGGDSVRQCLPRTKAHLGASLNSSFA
jgi:hypothetical protein